MVTFYFYKKSRMSPFARACVTAGIGPDQLYPSHGEMPLNEGELANLRKHVVRLRRAINQAKAQHPDSDNLLFVNHWPTNCCDAPYLFMMLYVMGYRNINQRCANVEHFGDDFERHVWLVVDEITIDITADQFPGCDDEVIVSRVSENVPLLVENRSVVPTLN